jgi:hypothetical protein
MSSCKGCLPTLMPTAYYSQVQNNVIQNHTEVKYVGLAPASVIVANDWNTPAEGDSVAGYLSNVYAITVGTYLYNPAYGWFLINSWNPQNAVIQIYKDDLAATVPAGTFVPAGTSFIVAPRPCCSDDTFILFPFLALNYVIPAIGFTTTINVTSVFGLQAGNRIRIGANVYLLTTIVSNNQVIIENEGAGGTPGDTVVALDSQGNYIYLLTTEPAFACSLSVGDTVGSIQICAGGTDSVLEPAVVADYQIPILTDAAARTVEYDFIGSLSIYDTAITTAKLAASAVTTAKINDTAVTTAKIADVAVTPSKIASAGYGTSFTCDSYTALQAPDVIVVSNRIATYTQLGPWVIISLRARLTCAASAGTVGIIYLTTPPGLPPLRPLTLQAYYPGVNVIGGVTVNGVEALFAYAEAATDTPRIEIRLATGAFLAPSQFVDVNAYFFYPTR